MSTLEVLRHLTALCRYQRPPGSPPARKYEHLCLAAITLPPPVQPTTPVPPCVPFTIEVWKETRGCVEAQLAAIYPIAMARVTF
ncbi:hypothetical protein [Methylobacterium sp. CM6246]